MDFKRNALTVPSQAVQRSPDGTFVYVVGTDGTVSERAVSLGAGPRQTAQTASVGNWNEYDR